MILSKFLRLAIFLRFFGTLSQSRSLPESTDGDREELSSWSHVALTEARHDSLVAKLPICRSAGSVGDNTQLRGRSSSADSGIMAEEAEFVEEGSGPAQSPLVTVSFQKNINRKLKFLEAEPKALGITQISLSLFNIFSAGIFLGKGVHHLTSETPLFVSSLLVAIAGSVALAARNLHLPTLKACLGLQIVACVACVVNMICTLVKMDDMPPYFFYHYYNSNPQYRDMFKSLESVVYTFYAESAIIQAVLFAISATLAAYCCKVVNCCAPAPKMPVITVQPPQSNSDETTGNIRTSAEML